MENFKGNVLFVTGIPETNQVYEGLERIKKMGYKVYLLSEVHFDPLPNVFENQFLFDIANTTGTLDFLKSQPIHFNAIITKSRELAPPLISLLAKHYRCIGENPRVVFSCRSKYHMRKKMREAGLPIPNFELCQNYEELNNAVSKIGIPCVLKPVGGHSSFGAFLIQNETDRKNLKEKYENAIRYLTALSDVKFREAISFTKEELSLMDVTDSLNLITDYLVEEYMEGPEISVDSLTQDGQSTIMGIADQVRMKPPFFIQIAEKMPLVCENSLEQKIRDLAHKTIKAMGIQNSPSHIEMILTKDGPKIVEIACRMGSDNIHDFIYQTTGYNMIYETMMIALGVPRNYELGIPKCHMAMEYLLPEKKGKITGIIVSEEGKMNQNITEMYFEKIGTAVAPPPENFDFLGYISTKGHTPHEAQKNLQKALEQVKIIIDE
ncbi:ATP-grasp domain-containing protein [Candidatus Gracilibacteria bacterium]|nr:ATP-grasp domain-containing protein [Candidatus Gracilibacteria bacterium]